MSGGYFNYAEDRVAEEYDGQWEDPEINDLFRDLFVGPIGKNGYRTGGLATALDLYKSGDCGEEFYRKEVARFKKKWFKTPRSKRLETYVDHQCETLKQKLLQMIRDDDTREKSR